MNGRARVSAPRGSRHAVVTVAGAAAVAVVLAFILVVVPQPVAVLEAAGEAWGPEWPPHLSLTDIGPDPEPEIGR